MRIAIIGSGVAGLTAGWALQAGGHEVTVFEAGPAMGGHTSTIPVPMGGQTWPVDTGFIVFNRWTYPNFIKLLDHLGVASRATTMSFSVRDDAAALEYNGHTANTLFAQRRNLLRPSHWAMIRGILRFNRESLAVLRGGEGPTLGELLERGRYPASFVRRYIVPMGAAIWSCPDHELLAMPARFFVRFFHNHGMLSVDDRPEWRTVCGGSSSYLAPLTATFAERIRLRTPVEGVRRDADSVMVYSAAGDERFDQVVMACHSDQALALLEDAGAAEREVLGAIPYQTNEAILHTDINVLPRRRACWAAWNYLLDDDHDGRKPVPVTYHMNLLQGFTDAPEQFLVTLNRGDLIDPARIIRRIPCHHPLFTTAGVAAQARWAEINGPRRTWYCGAYWGYGFHEDGVVSGLRVASGLGCPPPWGAIERCDRALAGAV